MHIIKTIASIPTKFCTVIKTTKCPSWVVRKHASQVQDGGRPPSWKIEKSPYLSNGLTDRHKIWHGDAVWPSLIFKFSKFKRSGGSGFNSVLFRVNPSLHQAFLQVIDVRNLLFRTRIATKHPKFYNLQVHFNEAYTIRLISHRNIYTFTVLNFTR